MKNLKNLILRIKQIITLPQYIITLILIALSIFAISLSWVTYDTFPFISSILSNIFAGLVTGIAICLVTGTKAMFNYNIGCKLAFLENVHEDCIKYINMHRELITKVNHQTGTDEELYNDIYDLLCAGNDVDAMISQSQFNKVYGFNPYKFFKKDMHYDALEQMKKNEELRELVIMKDVSSMSGKDILELFSEMQKNIFKLNSQVLVKVQEYKIRENLSQKTIF